MDVITGRAPPSHVPTYDTPRRVKSSHGLDILYVLFKGVPAIPTIGLPVCARSQGAPHLEGTVRLDVACYVVLYVLFN